MCYVKDINVINHMYFACVLSCTSVEKILFPQKMLWPFMLSLQNLSISFWLIASFCVDLMRPRGYMNLKPNSPFSHYKRIIPSCRDIIFNYFKRQIVGNQILYCCTLKHTHICFVVKYSMLNCTFSLFTIVTFF